MPNDREGERSDFHVLWGAAAIAEELGLTRRQTFYLLESGELPGRKIGRQWAVEKSVLRQFFTDADRRADTKAA
jgi:hypothetical protein